MWSADGSVTAIHRPSSGVVFHYKFLPSFSTIIVCVGKAEGLVEGTEVFQDPISMDLVLSENFWNCSEVTWAEIREQLHLCLNTLEM